MTAQGIPPYLLLLVAEKADLKTTSALMRTSKLNWSLIRSYEHSIAKEKANAILANTARAILSVFNEKRELLLANDFYAIQELAMREKRMDIILAGGFLLPTDKPNSFGFVPAQLERFKAGLKHGMRIADALSDLEAALVLALPPRPSAGDNKDALDEWVSEKTAKLRSEQRAHLHTLNTVDLVWLVELTQLAQVGYFRYKEGRYISDPQCTERLLAFRECIMRHGSFAIYAFVRGSGAMCRFVDDAVAGIFKEIDAWQKGEEAVLDGLHTTMMKILRARFVPGCNERDEWAGSPAADVVAEAITDAVLEDIGQNL